MPGLSKSDGIIHPLRKAISIIFTAVRVLGGALFWRSSYGFEENG
jgi:hypothetical protein